MGGVEPVSLPPSHAPSLVGEQSLSFSLSHTHSHFWGVEPVLLPLTHAYSLWGEQSLSFVAEGSETFALSYADSSVITGYVGRDIVQLGHYYALTRLGFALDCNDPNQVYPQLHDSNQVCPRLQQSQSDGLDRNDPDRECRGKDRDTWSRLRRSGALLPESTGEQTRDGNDDGQNKSGKEVTRMQDGVLG